MDDIYGDLENYEDVNAVAELRCENMELKSKLQEYTTNMAKLQKDLETLTTDYKKLEQNYSSLLKTAKSEIERKTQMISTLNIEKDMMVIDLVKNGINRNAHNLIRSSVKDKSHTTENKSSDNPKKNNSNSKVKDIPEKQKTEVIVDREPERNDKNTNSSLDKVSKISKNENNSINHTNVRENSSKIKDNTPYKLDSVVKPQALSITNRRKSMPAVRVDNAKFSEDEDTLRDKRNFSTKQTNDKKSAQKNFDEKYSSRKSDASSVEDRSVGYHDSTRDSYKSRSSRYFDHQKPRSRDRYETPHYRRHFSPDRTRRSQREYYEGHNLVPDYGRRRVTDSPPAEQYSQHRSRDHRPNYDRSQPYYQNDRNRDSYQDKQAHAKKHKISIGYDEPSSKRYKAHDRYSQESDRSKMDQDNLWHDGREFFVKETAFDPHNVDHISCQSPDYHHTDASNHQVKEIKSTAIVQLQDPRVTSKNYSIKKANDDKIVLSTIVGRNVDIKHIDKSIWNLQHLYLPDALLKHPLEMSENIVYDIYKDANNPEVNILLELGASEKNPNDKKEVNSQEKYDNCDSSSIIQSNPSKPINHISPTLKLETYRIPKRNQRSKDGPIEKIGECSKKSVYTSKDITRGKITSQEQKSKVDECKPDKTFLDRNTGKPDTVLPHKDNLKNINDLITYSNLLSSNDIVAGDLELSDETNDNADVHKQYVKKESKSKTPECKLKKRESSNVDKYSKGHKSTKSDTESNKHQTTIKIDPEKHQRDLTEHKSRNLKDHEGDTGKTPKSKKKSRHKDAIKESLPTIDNAQSTDKAKSKNQKESITSPVTNKFSDLFGDSNSLITPEDLGIHPVPTMSQTQYLPIFEDAQDAIDIDKNNDPKIELPKSCKQITDGGNTIISSKKEEMEHYNVDSSNKNVTKMNENLIVPVEVISNINPAENIVVSSGKDTGVVKTVIISRGVQPQNVMSSIEVPQNSLMEQITREANEGFKQINQTPLKALATSTPQKLLHNILQVNMEGKNPVSSCNSSESATTPSMDQSDSTLDTQDADIPDVRIFVRRRRKVTKKS